MVTLINIVELFILSFVTNYVYHIFGQIILSKYKKIYTNFKIKILDNVLTLIIGFVFISLVALISNFFTSLNQYFNSLIYLIILLIGIFFLKKNIFKSETLKFLLLISLLTSSLIIYSDVYRPDAYLYHLPYISILNNNEIIIGLNNIHFRYGLVSILQYTSALNFNILTNEKGILIPIASIVSTLIYYFYSILIRTVKSKKITYNSLFSFSILIYIVYKIIRYSEYGNDALPALLTFYLISKILEKKFIKDNFNIICLLSVFIFLNKTTMIIILIIPLIIFFKEKKYKEFQNIFFSIPTLLLLLWFFKNFLITGCLVYPLHYTCVETQWTNIKKTEIMAIKAESWSKGWPQNKKELTFKSFNKNFSWLEAWSEKHLIYILKIILPYLGVLFLISIISSGRFKKANFYNYKISIPFVVTFLGSIIFFLKFPLYRYGYGYLISFISLLFCFYNINNLHEGRLFNIFKIIIIIAPIIFFTKQSIRIYENFSSKRIWPEFQKVLSKKDVKENIILNQNGLMVYKDSNDCFYTNEICSQYDLDENLIVKKVKKYFILEIKK